MAFQLTAVVLIEDEIAIVDRLLRGVDAGLVTRDELDGAFATEEDTQHLRQYSLEAVAHFSHDDLAAPVFLVPKRFTEVEERRICPVRFELALAELHTVSEHSRDVVLQLVIVHATGAFALCPAIVAKLRR